MVCNSSGRLFQYFGAAIVKAASAYIDETSGEESFISSHLRLGRVVVRIMSIEYNNDALVDRTILLDYEVR